MGHLFPACRAYTVSSGAGCISAAPSFTSAASRARAGSRALAARACAVSSWHDSFPPCSLEFFYTYLVIQKAQVSPIGFEDNPRIGSPSKPFPKSHSVFVYNQIQLVQRMCKWGRSCIHQENPISPRRRFWPRIRGTFHPPIGCYSFHRQFVVHFLYLLFSVRRFSAANFVSSIPAGACSAVRCSLRKLSKPDQWISAGR